MMRIVSMIRREKLILATKKVKQNYLNTFVHYPNSNPSNNSYIVIGVQDEDNKITGVDFFDDSKIQNLINAYLSNPQLFNI